MFQLSNLKEALQEFKATGLNILFGAGVSRNSPTNAPIWNEMQVKFLMAIFDRMAAESWPIASEFPADREAAQNFRIRPETFWSQMVEIIGSNTVHKALKAADMGIPNNIHYLIAQLLATGVLKNAVTTNYDEYIEKVLPDSVQIIVASAKWEESLSQEVPRYIKLHGTISSATSLSYTLEHYDALYERNKTILLTALSGRPLIIAGYSGYDTDVLPALREVSEMLPLVIVIRHPGADLEQPILKADSERDNWQVIEATCEDVFSTLSEQDGFKRNIETHESITKDGKDPYLLAAESIPLPICPVVLLTAFDLVGNQGGTFRYAWLAHDAAIDNRYRSSLSIEEHIDLHILVGTALAKCGDFRCSAMFAEAESLAKSTESTNRASIFTRIAMTRTSAMSRLNFVIGNNKSAKPATIKERMDSSLFSTEVAKYFQLDYKTRFAFQWDIGLQKKREHDYDGAVAAFDKAIEALLKLPKNSTSHLERGRFFLDMAGAIALKAEAARDEEGSIEAIKMLGLAEHECRAAHDWKSHARVLLNMSRMFLSWNTDHIENIKKARSYIEAAKKSVSLTDEHELKKSIEAHSAAIDKFGL